jgi:hypothetical protein
MLVAEKSFSTASVKNISLSNPRGAAQRRIPDA